MIFENYKSAVYLNLRNKDSFEYLEKSWKYFFFVLFFQGFQKKGLAPWPFWYELANWLLWR